MCGLAGICDTSGARFSGEEIIRAMAVQRDRGNGLGAGYAGYGIYPEFAAHQAFHVMYDDIVAKEAGDHYFEHMFVVDRSEPIPTAPTTGITDEPLLWRYFVTIDPLALEKTALTHDDYIVDAVMHINTRIPGAFVASSGRNMGVFKGVGFPEEIGHFYRLDEYEGTTWTAHNRFPTNTPGWWGGAHPFSLLDFSIVHNGELSSYGINARYVEQYGYHCTMGTDTEVVAYLFDKMMRRDGLTALQACHILAAPLWSQIDAMEPAERTFYTSMRKRYASALLNGPFAIVLGTTQGMIAFNDRIKLRPLLAAQAGSKVYVASEESSIRAVCPNPDRLWAPRAGEPVVAQIVRPDSAGTSANAPAVAPANALADACHADKEVA